MKKQFSAGFTLIEILVVATIVIVLGTLGMVSFSQASKSARDSKRKADVETIRQAATLYRQQYTAYPADYTTMGGTYLSQPVPKDPTSNGNYSYSGGATFCVCATMESTSPKGNANNSNCSDIGTTTAGSLYCAKNL